MMREVLTPPLRARAQGGPGAASGGTWPDLVLIDGGQGQLAAALRGVRRARHRRRRRGRRSPRGRTAMPAASASSCRAASRSARAARPGALFPAAPARRGAPLRHRRAPRQALASAIGSRRSTRSPASAPSARRRCCCISARPRAVARAGLADLERVERHQRNRGARRSMTTSTAATAKMPRLTPPISRAGPAHSLHVDTSAQSSLTLSRIIAIPVRASRCSIVAAATGSRWHRAARCSPLAGVTDYFDGYVARRWSSRSRRSAASSTRSPTSCWSPPSC